ncbi:DUF434 domain-containing protein [Desulfacinum hydrothermale]|uniref:DUF434 domain-containing protein n=1 Tax=Desulfacinum hydrothermale TaxID=109258 RepID=UPI001482AA55|nr:DUF434 domain-containing protein [Desulfacinum hydrothermale]
MNDETGVIHEAAEDLFLLLNKGYPRSSAITWVGNRYNLPREGRELLRRGIFSQTAALRRRAKKVRGAAWRSRLLVVDGHNVHITVESALLRRPLVVGNDGALRDIAALSARFRPGPTTQRVVDLVCGTLERFLSAQVRFYFDAPMSRSGELAGMYERCLKELGVPGWARAVAVPEQHFPARGCVIASSDRAVVDGCESWLDLARWVIDYHRLAHPAFDFSYLIHARPAPFLPRP